MTLALPTRRRLRRYWSDRLGVDPAAFDASGVAVGAGETDGVELLVIDGALLLGAPPDLADACKRAADDLAALDPDDGGAVRDWLDGLAPMRTIHGPTFYGYADGETFEPVAGDARVLDAADESAFETLRAAVPDDEWDQGGPEFAPGTTVGCFVDDDLVSVADYDVWDDLIAHVGVVTHPDHRSAGNGRAVVSRVAERALADGLIPQYRTSDAWPWSVALARGLGFERFATAYLGVTEQ